MKIGIITHYYKSVNYGGNLQAYALCKAISKLGYQCEQIKFVRDTYELGVEREEAKQKQKKKKFLSRCFYRVINYPKHKIFHKMEKNINNAFEKWRKENVPESLEVYNNENIHNCLSNYDAFITGSDQVWNIKWYTPIYFLGFAENCPKISYAASMCQQSLNDCQKMVIKEHLSDFISVSVRESDTVDLIKDLSPVKVENTLDPTLLLDTKEWNEITSDRIVKEKYLFCHFIHENDSAMKVAFEYAKQKKLKVVVIKNLGIRTKEKTLKYADIKLKTASPSEFLSLIKYSDCIFTDSFHVTVFSGSFEKEVFVFTRNDETTMKNRIYNLIDLYGIKERFCDTENKATIEHINSCEKIDYFKGNKDLEEMKERSLSFLKTSLQKAEEIVKQ